MTRLVRVHWSAIRLNRQTSLSVASGGLGTEFFQQFDQSYRQSAR